MSDTKQIVGNTTDELWQQVSADLADDETFEYNVLLVKGGTPVELVIDIDLGGGFEGGSAYVSFTAAVSPAHDFRFALHHEDWIDRAGKLLGLEDVEIGYPEFDAALIIKTDDKDRTQQIFSDASTRATFQSLRLFTLHLTHHHVSGEKGKQPLLELIIEEDINDPEKLRVLYDAFCNVLDRIEAG